MALMDSKNRLVWVVCGGISTEHDVSLVSGRGMASALASGGWRVRPVAITRTGGWRVSERIIGPKETPAHAAQLMDALAREDALAFSCDKALARLQSDSPLCVLIALHGTGGEDGAIQGMFNWLGVRYAGSGPSASALGMNKIRCQAFFERLGFRVPPAVSSIDLPETARADPGAHARALAQRANERLPMPVFVKPGFGGSSLGMALVDKREEVEAAVGEALKVSAEALVEERIAGRELTCGVIEMSLNNERPMPRALPVTEIRPVRSRYFDYEAKYTPGACEEITPAPLDEAAALRVQEAALRAHTLLGARGMSRVDFILRDDGELFILEINTIPGMTPTSLLPQAAASAGLSYLQLCECMIRSSLYKNKLQEIS